MFFIALMLTMHDSMSVCLSINYNVKSRANFYRNNAFFAYFLKWFLFDPNVTSCLHKLQSIAVRNKKTQVLLRLTDRHMVSTHQHASNAYKNKKMRRKKMKS